MGILVKAYMQNGPGQAISWGGFFCAKGLRFEGFLLQGSREAPAALNPNP